MEPMTRDEMVAEFGEPGVQNATLMDLITFDAAADKVILAMFERRAWGASALQFQQIEEKINRYMGYVLDGFLVEHYPKYAGKRVQLRLDCAQEPHGPAIDFVTAAQHAIEEHGMEFVVNVSANPVPA